jgi:hypothetical protein
MTATINKVKAAIRETPFFGPLKWLAALLGRSRYPLPFSYTLSVVFISPTQNNEEPSSNN